MKQKIYRYEDLDIQDKIKYLKDTNVVSDKEGKLILLLEEMCEKIIFLENNASLYGHSHKVNYELE